MDLRRKIEEKQHDIEKVLITVLFLTVIFSLFFEEKSAEISFGIIAIQIALVLFYTVLLQNKIYGLFWLAFFLQLMSYFILQHLSDKIIVALAILPFFSFGILILVKSAQSTIRYKSFELLTFIVGFLLVIQVALPFIKTNEEILTFYSFALSFAIGTIIYNDNLWHRYNSDEKNLLKFILLVVLGIVIQSSAKFI